MTILAEYKINRNYEVTPANTHDSQVIEEIVSLPEPGIGEEKAASTEQAKKIVWR